MKKSIKNIIYTGKNTNRNKANRNKANRNKTVKKKNNPYSVKEDPFNHFNFGWLNNNPLPKSRIRIGIFSNLSNQVKKQIHGIIKECETSENASAKKCWNIYNAYKTTSDTLVTSHLKNKYSILCDILNNGDNLEHLYKFMIENSISLPFMWSVNQDSRDVKKHISHLSDTGFSLPDKDLYLLDENKETVKEYIKYVKNMFEHIFGKDHSYDIESIIEVETYLARYTPDFWENQNSDKNYNKVSGSELKEMGLDWEKFSKIIGYKTPPKYVILNTRVYFERAFGFLNKHWNGDKMKSYWVYKTIQSFSEFDSTLKKMEFNFFGKYLHGRKKEVPINKEAIDIVCDYMNTHISKEYLARYCDSENIKYIEGISEDIRDQFKKRLDKNGWLTEITKKKAIKKLDHIRFFIGCKKGFIDDPTVKFCSNDSYKNYLLYVRWEEKTMIDLESREYDVNIWNRLESGDVFSVNAYYNPLNNEVVLPCGILQAPFVDRSKGLEYALGFLGATIGHELTHSLDDDGCKYDYNGKYLNWWNVQDMDNYKKKQKRLIGIYKKIVEKDGYDKIDHRLSLGENIADVGGLDICQDLLMSYYTTNNIPKEEQERRLKKFFKFYVYEWRDKSTKKYKNEQMKTDEHLSSKYRCNGTLSNSMLFKTTYKLDKHDSMYVEDQVTIW